MIQLDGNHYGNLCLSCEGPVFRVGDSYDRRAGVAKFCNQIDNFHTAAATRNQDDRRIRQNDREIQQLGCVNQISGVSTVRKQRRSRESRMPTAADSGQVDMASATDCGCRRVQSGPARSRKNVDGPF